MAGGCPRFRAGVRTLERSIAIRLCSNRVVLAAKDISVNIEEIMWFALNS